MGQPEDRWIAQLTERELDVLELIADDWTNGEIAERLVISAETVKAHVTNILNKLGATDRREAGRMYRRSRGWNGGRTGAGDGRILETRVAEGERKRRTSIGGPAAIGLLRWPASAAAVVLLALYLALTTHLAGSEEQPRNPHSEEMVEAYARAVGDAMPFRQRLAVVDGVVTLAEYEAAIQRYYACVADAGMTPDPEPARGLRPSTVGVVIPDDDGIPDPQTLHRFRRALDACRFDHLEDINTAWALQQARTPEPVIQQSLDLVEACLAAGGVERTFATLGELVNARHNGFDSSDPEDQLFAQIYTRDCRFQVEEVTGFHLP